MNTKYLKSKISVIVATFALAGMFLLASCGDDEPKTKVLPNFISLNKGHLELNLGESFQLIATVEPDNATDKTVLWSVTGSGVSVDDDGLVTATNNGTAVVTATAKANPEVYVNCHVKAGSGSGGGGGGGGDDPSDDNPQPTLPGYMWGTEITNP